VIEGSHYIEIVKAYFNFLITEFSFKIREEKLRGNAFYDVAYEDVNRIVSISYENIDDYFQVVIFMLKNGELPDYDDKTRTLHLNIINAQVLSSIEKREIDLNNEYFLKFTPKHTLERKLLKSAKELRLYLKRVKALEM